MTIFNTHRRLPTVPCTGFVDLCARVDGFLRPSSWSSFLRIASSLRICRLRAMSAPMSEADEAGGEWVEDETTVRFADCEVLTVDPTVEPDR